MSQAERAFQATIKRIGLRTFEYETLRHEPPAIRMLIATRAIEGQVDNGGWPAVFYNDDDDLVPLAIEGYGLLGLSEHAALASIIFAHGFASTDDDAVWEAFDNQWFSLPSAEDARAEYIRTHVSEFRRHPGLGVPLEQRSRLVREDGVPSGE